MRQLAWGMVAIVVLWGTTAGELTAGKWKKSGCAGCATPYPGCSSPFPSCATPYQCASPKFFKRGCATPYGCSGGWGCSAPMGCASSCAMSCAGSCAAPLSCAGELLYGSDHGFGDGQAWPNASAAPLVTNYYQPVHAMQAPIPGVPVAEDLAW